MANRIKGITVEIGGDTTKLSKALEGVNKNIKNTQTQLKDVQKLLKLDPTNTELLSQKHKLLADAVKATKEKLETLKTAAEQANQALANGDISQEQYDALQREIIETEQELQNLQREAEASSTALAKLGQAGEMLEKAGDKIADVGKTLTTHVTVSVPDEGPLADFESWMPDFMQGLATGINKSKKNVEKAVAGGAETMKLTMQSDLSYQLDGVSAAVVGSTGGASVINNYYNNDNSRTVNQTNNSPKSLSRLEIYRMTRNALNV